MSNKLNSIAGLSAQLTVDDLKESAKFYQSLTTTTTDGSPLPADIISAILTILKRHGEDANFSPCRIERNPDVHSGSVLIQKAPTSPCSTAATDDAPQLAPVALDAVEKDGVGRLYGSAYAFRPDDGSVVAYEFSEGSKPKALEGFKVALLREVGAFLTERQLCGAIGLRVSPERDDRGQIGEQINRANEAKEQIVLGGGQYPSENSQKLYCGGEKCAFPSKKCCTNSEGKPICCPRN